MGVTVTRRGDTEPMMVRVFWLMRFTGYVVIGLLALINPPHSHPQRAVQIACFTVVGAALLACVYLDLIPRLRERWLPVALSAMAGSRRPQ